MSAARLGALSDSERADRPASPINVEAVRAALEAAEGEFTNGDQPGANLRTVIS